MLWLEEFTATNSWDKEQVYDVLIVGGGITGLSAALLLQEKGKKCILAEAHNIGFGTSGGTTAHLNTLLDTPYAQIEKDFGHEAAQQVATGAREAIDLIEGLVSKYSISCDLSYKAGYLYAETDKEAADLEKIKEANEKVSVLTEWSETIPVPIPFKKAIKVDFQGQIHATKYLNGLAKAFEKMGGVILQNCEVTTLKEEEIISAETSLGTINASNAVYATHIPPGVNIFSFRCAPYRSYAMAFTLKSGQYPDGLAYDSKDPYHYFRSHTIEGVRYVIAGGFDHKTGQNDNTEYVFTELEAYVRNYYDVDTVPYQWSSQYYNSVDGLPYIGLMPGHEHVYVATGYGGNGLVFGSLAAKTICSLIHDEPTQYEELFDPSRIKMIAGFSTFVKENANVISQFVGKYFGHEHIEQLAQLAPGQATVAEWQGSKVALYKDDKGKIHALDPVCPHAKCVVAWNSAEKSWDCPCHGSRFAPDGALLTGPATKGLHQIKPEPIDGD